METDLTKINSIIDGYQYRKRFLLSILLDIQEEYEYISRNALICVSERLNIPLIRVYGVASLYKALKLESGIKASIGIEGQESLKEDYLWKFR